MTRLLFLLVLVAAMVVDVVPNSLCATGYSPQDIPNFEILKLPDSDVHALIDDKDFSMRVHDCYFKEIECDLCAQREKQIMEVLPWLLRDCAQNPNICDRDLKNRANRFAVRIQQEYPKEYSAILASLAEV